MGGCVLVLLFFICIKKYQVVVIVILGFIGGIVKFFNSFLIVFGWVDIVVEELDLVFDVYGDIGNVVI